MSTFSSSIQALNQKGANRLLTQARRLLAVAECPNCGIGGARSGQRGDPERCQWCLERNEFLATVKE